MGGLAPCLAMAGRSSAEEEEEEEEEEEAEPLRRSRATANPAAPAAIFYGVVARRGHVFCRHPDEQQSVGSAKLYLDALPAEYELLAGTHATQPNLAIGTMLTEKALDLTMAKIERCQTMSDSLKTDMKTCLLRRVRNMCKAVAQGIARRPQPKWVAALP